VIRQDPLQEPVADPRLARRGELVPILGNEPPAIVEDEPSPVAEDFEQGTDRP
jgi:hypothetical protein